MLDDPKLLVVDDEEVICEGCRRIFSKQGFEVEKCSDACKGLSLATENDYSAILLDIKMPNMDGIEFLKSLRQRKPEVPVVLMTGYPSIPNAASAIRFGASDYVTKPFTPEEISQAVHRLLHSQPNEGSPTASVSQPAAAAQGFRFWRDTWFRAADEGAACVGTLLVAPGAAAVAKVVLPRIGEVVYQGLPLAAVTVAGRPEVIVHSPLSGVVVAVNDALQADPAAILNDPCGQGWIACISPTRLEDEAKSCQVRHVILCNPTPTAAAQAEKLRWLGCEVTEIADVASLSKSLQPNEPHVVLVDGPAFGAEGPAMVGQINTIDPAAKVVVIASSDCTMESAYRIRRIFYYAVEPFADNEIAEIFAGAFQSPSHAATADRRREAAQPLNSIIITNHNRTRVRIVAAPGLLRREEGLGRLLRHKLMQRLLPIESSPDEYQITPMNLLGLAARCDRLIVLLVQDAGRLPGSLIRDTKSEFVSLSGEGADKVTTLVVQPGLSDAGPLAFDPVLLDSLAEQVVREMATC